MKLSECYKLLNASPEMEWREVKRSYHSLAKRFHPDIQPANSIHANRFRKINQAYKILETLYNNEKSQSANDPVTAATPQTKTETKPIPKAMPWHGSHAEPSESRTNKVKSPGLLLKGLRRIRKMAFDFERKYLLLDVKKRITLSPRLAAIGCSIRIRKGQERFQVRIPRGPWSRLFLRVPQKGNLSVLSFLRGDLLLEILVKSGGEVATRDSRFFYNIKVPRRYVRWGQVLTLQSSRGPIQFTLPKSAEDGQEFSVETVADSSGEPPSKHIVRVQLV